MESEPRRGEIWLVSLGTARPGEPGKNRPAVVLSADELRTGSADDLTVVVPMSRSRHPSPLRPVVRAEPEQEDPGFAVCRAVRSVSRRRLLRRLGKVDQTTLGEIEFSMRLTLGLG